jgi:hypothetical protein
MENSTPDSTPSSQPDNNSSKLKIEEYDATIDAGKTKRERDLQNWEKIGFQRQLGGWMYGFSISILTMLVGVLLIGFLTKLLYPYPEQKGYMNVSGVLFAVVYQIFDIGTSFGIRRFIAEYRVKNPNKMLEYIRFFIWYQMLTGIIQVLVISIVILRIVVNTDLAYTTWIMLIACQKQWPGMLGTFKSVIDGLQHHNKTHILNFINGEIFQQATNVIFILLFRNWGANNPQYGELMGMVIGMAIGGYVDDFFAMMLAGYYYNKIMQPYGITFRESWRFDFGKDVVRNCLYYGFQVSIVPIIGSFLGTFITLIYISLIPQFTTWGSLAALGGSIAGIVGVWDFNLAPSIAEAYPNGKVKLSQFYIAYAFKWQNFFAMLYLEILLAYYPIVIFFINNNPGMENYQLATVFILPMVIPKLFGPIFNIPGDVMWGALHITADTILRFIEMVANIFFVWLFVIVIRVHMTFGMAGIVFLFAFDGFFAKLIKNILGWIYVKKKIMKIKLYWMTSVILPLIAGLPIVIFSGIWTKWFIFPLIDLIGLLPATAVTVLFGIFCIPFFVFLPLTGVVGMWDDFQLYTFRTAVHMSGPSRIFFIPFLKAIETGVKVGRKLKLHNRFRIPWEEAEQEIIELNQMKIDARYVKQDKVAVKSAPWMKKVNLD